MVQRLVDVLVPPELADEARRLIDSAETLRWWELAEFAGTANFRALVQAKQVEPLLDALQSSFIHHPEFRAVVQPVEASVPKVEEPKKEESETPEDETGKKKKARDRVSRAELIAALEPATVANRVFLITVILSTVVAAIGLTKNSAAVLIGAMVVAPLLGPNMALALATTLGDAKLAGRALRTNLVGFVVALGLSMVLGWTELLGSMVEVDGESHRLKSEILLRTQVDVYDLILALAAGAAGALAFTSNVLSSLVGVMVAVALMPPLVVVGMMLAAGYDEEAGRAFLLLIGNIVCVLLAATTTFLLQGLGPRQWWREKASKRRSLVVVGLLLVLFGVLVAMVNGLATA